MTIKQVDNLQSQFTMEFIRLHNSIINQISPLESTSI
jgi:hypothetical protein